VAANKAVEQQAEATRKEEENKPAAEAAKRAEERLEAEKKKPKFGDHECARESPNREAWSIAAAYGEYSTMEGRRLEENKRNRCTCVLPSRARRGKSEASRYVSSG
jgi:hypothetical protein